MPVLIKTIQLRIAKAITLMRVADVNAERSTVGTPTRWAWSYTAGMACSAVGHYLRALTARGPARGRWFKSGEQLRRRAKKRAETQWAVEDAEEK